MFLSINVAGNVHQAVQFANTLVCAPYLWSVVPVSGGSGAILIFKISSREDRIAARKELNLTPEPPAERKKNNERLVAIEEIIANVMQLRRGTFDTHPTRMLPLTDEAKKIDEWWQDYFLRNHAANREIAGKILVQIDAFKFLL